MTYTHAGCSSNFSSFQETSCCLPWCLDQFIFPLTMYKGSPFFTSFPTFVICRHYDDNHSGRCEVMSLSSFDLHFSNYQGCWASFHVPISHLYVFSGEISFQVLYPFLDWVVCFIDIELYELFIYFNIASLLVTSFANIFSHSIGCFFLLCEWFLLLCKSF